MIFGRRKPLLSKMEEKHMNTKQAPFVIERAQAEDAAALLAFLKIVGGETENLSYGAEGISLDLAAEQTSCAVRPDR